MLPYKTLAQVEKLATEYGLSRANMLMKLVEAGLIHEHRESVEVSSVTEDGDRRKDGVAITIHNGARKIL